VQYLRRELAAESTQGRATAAETFIYEGKIFNHMKREEGPPLPPLLRHFWSIFLAATLIFEFALLLAI
jgi:hypothetical protein